MKASPGSERNKAVGRHLRTYPGSALAGALRTVADEWRKAAEKTVFEGLVRELAAARSDAERLSSCERFLAGHPRGERAKEVRALRAAYERVTGMPAGLAGIAAVTDANRLVGVGHVPTVLCGFESRTAHADREVVRVEKLREPCRVVLLTALNYLEEDRES